MTSIGPRSEQPVLAIANGDGFWGDNVDAPFLLARNGHIDVLTLEYLAELTMAILSHLHSRDPNAGFVTDFPELVAQAGSSPDREKRPAAGRHQCRRAESAVVCQALRPDPEFGRHR